MKTETVSHALVELSRRASLTIEPRNEADAAAVLGEVFEAGHRAGVKSVPVAGTEDGVLTPDEIAVLRSALRERAAVATKPAAGKKR